MLNKGLVMVNDNIPNKVDELEKCWILRLTMFTIVKDITVDIVDIMLVF